LTAVLDFVEAGAAQVLRGNHGEGEAAILLGAEVHGGVGVVASGLGMVFL
jgi:hypothetical protein